MLRKIAAGFFGVVTAGFATAAGEKLSHLVFPPPENLDFNNLDQLKAFHESIPNEVFLILIAVWALSSFIGGFVAGIITTYSKQKVAMVVGGVLLFFAAINFSYLPHPMWVVVLSLSLYVPMAFLGATLVVKKLAPNETKQ